MLGSGDDATAATYRAMGGTGCISVAANVAPALCALLDRAWDDGDLARLAALRDVRGPLNAALLGGSNPIPANAALVRHDPCEDDVRLRFAHHSDDAADATPGAGVGDASPRTRRTAAGPGADQLKPCGSGPGPLLPRCPPG